MKVIIAEKPSVARSIAAVLGATSQKDGYIEGGNYTITWALGHLVTLAMPESYGFTGFQRENLPILPKNFILVPRQIREGKEYKPDPGALKQLKVIRELFNKADEIIAATDAGREGELIFRYIHQYIGCNTPFCRLWISSLTDKAIKDGFKTLHPGSNYDNLYLSAKARSQADWIVGINASQALSIAAGHGVWSLGRVQTPTLAMICSRYLEHKDFKPKIYFRLKIHTVKGNTAFTVLSEDKYDARPLVDEVSKSVHEAGSLLVTGVEKKEVHQESPLLHDLTSLQKEANKQHGFSADKTLNIAQSLYEVKKISYPRTGSRYIPDDLFDEIPHLIATLREHPLFGNYIMDHSCKALNSRPVNDKRVTDHHALIITGESTEGLSKDEQIIYDMVAGRMLEAFGERCTKENTIVTLEAGKVHFVAKGSIMLHSGWHDVFKNNQEETDGEEFTSLPDLKEGDLLGIRYMEVQEKQTKPKPLHTEASLLSAMESTGKEVGNEKEREAMKDAGIGTPATRAAIIETLFSRDYIRREKKSLVPTDKGLTVFLAIREKKIADVSMTGQWELALSKIGTGEMNADTFHRSIEVYASQITTELLDMHFEHKDGRPSCPCSKCGTGNVVFYPKVAKCNNEACGLTIFRSIVKKELSDAQLTSLLTNGKTGVIKGFTSNKTAGTFDAAIKLDGDYKTVFDFSKNKDKSVNKRKSK